jgi:hypothetical protein
VDVVKSVLSSRQEKKIYRKDMKAQEKKGSRVQGSGEKKRNRRWTQIHTDNIILPQRLEEKKIFSHRGPGAAFGRNQNEK